MTKMPAEKRYGIVNSDELRAMSGLEFVQGLVAGSLPLNTMARAIGYDIVEAAQGRVVVTANSSEEHLNPEGTVHGGVAATLLDTCMGLAVRSMLEKGDASTTLEFKVSFLRPITKETGLLRAEIRFLTKSLLFFCSFSDTPDLDRRSVLWRKIVALAGGGFWMGVPG